MTRSEVAAEVRAGIAGLLETRLPGLRLLYCFGSVARGEANSESDLDLAVLAAAPVEPLARLDLVRELSELAAREVDLVDLMKAPAVLRLEVVEGELWFASSEFERDAFEARVLGEYARLSEERALLVEDAYRRAEGAR
jgi:predicted nucleotidyltransferase